MVASKISVILFLLNKILSIKIALHCKVKYLKNTYSYLRFHVKTYTAFSQKVDVLLQLECILVTKGRVKVTDFSRQFSFAASNYYI